MISARREARIEHGFDDDAIARVMGGNVRRLLVDVLPGGIATVC